MQNRLIFPGQKIDFNEKKSSHAISSTRESVFSIKKRSKDYLNFISKLEDIDVYKINGFKELTDKISNEIGPLGLASSPIGILAKCFLGAPFDVHILGLEAEIILNHYKISEPLPPSFSKARLLALHNQYSIVEVYNDKFILIDSDGNTTNIKN